MFSMTHITACVCSCARLMASAMNAIDSFGVHFPSVDPGLVKPPLSTTPAPALRQATYWKLYRVRPSISQRFKSSRKA